MANKSYIHIDSEAFEVMKLTPTEAVIYSLVAGYCNHGQRFETQLPDLCARINISDRSARYIISDLCKRGYLRKTRKQAAIELALSDEWKSIGVENGKICRTCSAKSAEENGKNCRTERQNLPNTPYIINSNNNPNNKGENGDFYEIFLKVFTEHFKATHEGREYTPNFPTLSTAVRNIMASINVCMTNDGYVPDRDTTEAYFSQWISLAWNRTDHWHRERWTIDFVNSQFVYFNNIVNTPIENNNNGNQRKQNGISDEYIRQQFEKIARSRAARSGVADDTSSTVGR